MRYFAYKKKWEDGQGSHPCQYLLEIGTVAEPAFDNGGVNGEDCYGYLLSGEFDEHSIAEWDIREISEAEILEAGKALEESAHLIEGRVHWQRGNMSDIPHS